MNGTPWNVIRNEWEPLGRGILRHADALALRDQFASQMRAILAARYPGARITDETDLATGARVICVYRESGTLWQSESFHVVPSGYSVADWYHVATRG